MITPTPSEDAVVSGDGDAVTSTKGKVDNRATEIAAGNEGRGVSVGGRTVAKLAKAAIASPQVEITIGSERTREERSASNLDDGLAGKPALYQCERRAAPLVVEAELPFGAVASGVYSAVLEEDQHMLHSIDNSS